MNSISLRTASILALLTTIFISMVLFLGMGQVSAADTKNRVCGGANIDLSADADCKDFDKSENRLTDTVKSIVNIITIIVGIAAVIMVIIGGAKFITSGGDAGSITSAKQTVIYALVGLVVVALAQVIVRFVLSNV